jgi:superfamily II DNA or RNA helicase
LVTDDDIPENVLAPEAPTTAEPSGPALYAWQREALGAWRANERRGVVEAVTGTGESRVAVDAIAETIEAGGRALVIVPTIDLVDQWHSILSAAFPQLGGQVGRYDDRPGAYPSLIHQRIVVSTVHTAARGVTLPDGALCLLVADECHHYGAATFRLALDDRFQRRLGLTATYERYRRRPRVPRRVFWYATCVLARLHRRNRRGCRRALPARARRRPAHRARAGGL